jgi:hypothetical protein
MMGADVPWPLDTTPEATLRYVIRTCARPARSKRGGVPRWSIVSAVTGNGSTYSARLCVWAGVDPDERCVRRG